MSERSPPGSPQNQRGTQPARERETGMSETVRDEVDVLQRHTDHVEAEALTWALARFEAGQVDVIEERIAALLDRSPR
jgi:hypothetical protein